LSLSRMSVNVSAIEIGRPTFADEVEALLGAIPLCAGVLEIELTESAIMGNLAESTRQMKKLRALGVRLAIDDFGTGYSSLSYLQTLPIDSLKIDRSFVQAIDGGYDKAIPGHAPLVYAIIALGRTLGLHIVAEGIETEMQLSALTQGAHGLCERDYIQGYLLGRPQPASDAGRLIPAALASLPLLPSLVPSI